MQPFTLNTEFTPRGDQPKAIESLVKGIDDGLKHQTLLGVTGSGKTFTVANVIARTQRPSLIIAPNKTLAAQLYAEFRELFPSNAVEFFVSYYDYYQPEAYLPNTDTFIEKDSSINDQIDKMRHSATRSLFTRRDVIVVASVSCIYGLGSPENYGSLHVHLQTEQELERDALLRSLVDMQYERNEYDFHRGTFRVRGDCVEIFPAYEEKVALRIEFFGDTIDKISSFDPITGKRIYSHADVAIYPSSHYVVASNRMKNAVIEIKADLKTRLAQLFALNKLVEHQRLEQRTKFDIEMLEETGYCSGIENYSRYLDGRTANQPPYTLLDYFPKDFLLFVDESHVSVPQIGAMYSGDRSRKMNLVEYGFRLPAALDNRPLSFPEYEERTNQVVYVSATPADYEFQKSAGVVIQQIIRPTGLLDPQIEIRKAGHQVDDLLLEIKARIECGERVLVTTLTKRMAEDLTDYYSNAGINVRYLHSDIDTIERTEIIRDLRLKVFDVLVGINLLREGLDIPEVSLVAILDADKEGFLRSERSLVQTFGRAARNERGTVLLYADTMTKSMKKAIDETNRRREIQEAYNREHGIVPKSVAKKIEMALYSTNKKNKRDSGPTVDLREGPVAYMSPKERDRQIKWLKDEMMKAARSLEFEKAAEYRDQLLLLEKDALV